MTPLGLYIHIPWCPTRCIYCDFNTYVSEDKTLKARYQTALKRELCESAAALGHPPLKTIFFGGGTPTTLAPDELLDVVTTVRAQFAVSAGAEITTEANPGSLSLDYLRAIRQGGINRLSLGVQSFHNDELQRLSRLHDVEAVYRTVTAARQAGFDNLSLDLIFNLPQQTLDQWAYNLRAAIELQPDHLSIYALIVEPGTPLQRQVAQGQLPLPDDDLAADMYALTIETLASAGYVQYEISNWARLDSAEPAADWHTPPLASAHNLIYWRNQPYLGVGAGAFGTMQQTRWANVKRPQDYITRVLTGQGLGLARNEATVEPLDSPTMMTEHLLLGLRLVREGVSEAEFRARFGVGLAETYQAAIASGLANKLLMWLAAESDWRLRLTPQGRFFANQAILPFMETA